MFSKLKRLSLLTAATVGLLGLASVVSAQDNITKAQRELVVLQADLGSDFLYEFVEDQGVSLAVSTLTRG